MSKVYVWVNGRKTELLPPIDDSDFPKKYVVCVYGDDPHSGCVYCGMETAKEMRDINEDGYWEWLSEESGYRQGWIDIYSGELNEERIKEYTRLAETYNISIGSVRDIFCRGAGWYKSLLPSAPGEK